MANQLDNDMLPLGKLFSQEFFFRIPEYQRPFLWDEDDFSDLISDLLGASREEPYFLGTLVLHHSPEGAYHDVVDGQQRLTALCILLACIRDSQALATEEKFIEELHEKLVQPERVLDAIGAKERLQVRDQEVFNSIIKVRGAASRPLTLPSKPSPGELRYELARKTFWKKLEPLSKDEIQSFVKFIMQQCKLLYLATDSFESAFHLFAVVNDRGKQLRRIDVLKAFNLDPRYISSDDSRSRYAARWEDMENLLGESKFEEIFHLLRLIYVKDKPQYDLHSEFSKRILGKPDMPRPGSDFLDQVRQYVQLYNSLFVDRDFLDDDAAASRHAQFHTLMEIMEGNFEASEWKSCLLLSASKFGKEKFYSLVLAIEKVYLDLWVRGVRKDERYGVYTKLLRMIEAVSNIDAVIESISDIDLGPVFDACRAKNFYGANYKKYLLLRAEVVTGELDAPRHFEARSIEHVLPQNPHPESEWMKIFSEEEHEELVNTVGNLVLLSRTKNSSAGRHDFDAKKKTYLKPRVSDFPRSIQVLDHSEWNPTVIKERTEQFISIVLTDPSE
jgi:hypothetical protein